jgi:hypothetical protein
MDSPAFTNPEKRDDNLRCSMARRSRGLYIDTPRCHVLEYTLILNEQSFTATGATVETPLVTTGA